MHNLKDKLNELITKENLFISRNDFFLIDESIIKQITEFINVNKKDSILEFNIGFFLFSKFKEKINYTVFEKKEDFKEFIINSFKFNVIDSFNDVSSFNKLITLVPGKLPLKELIILLKQNPSKLVLIASEEVSFKIRALPGFVDYSALSVLLSNFFELIKEKKLSKESFFPQSFINYDLFLFEKKKDIESNFIDFLKQIFRFQKKNLIQAVCISFKEIKELIKFNDLKELKKCLKSNKKLKSIINEKVFLVKPNDFIIFFNELKKT